MALSEELLTALLSMDSYNRGYNAGIEGLYDQNTSIGTATFLSDSEVLIDGQNERLDIPASFYAAAYSTSYGTIVSYRGITVTVY